MKLLRQKIEGTDATYERVLRIEVLENREVFGSKNLTPLFDEYDFILDDKLDTSTYLM